MCRLDKKEMKANVGCSEPAALVLCSSLARCECSARGTEQDFIGCIRAGWYTGFCHRSHVLP